MKKINKEILKTIQYATKGEVKRINCQWPPFCTGILHQPQRPVKKKID